MQVEKYNAHLAILLANTIFGLGVPVTSYLLSEWISPMGYMAFRCFGAAAIFWAISLFLPKEHVERRDLITILLGGLLGFVISQSLTAWALEYTTPVYFSLIATLTPVATMLLAALFLGETITRGKSLGVVIAILGAALLVFAGWTSGTGKNDPLGITLGILSLLTWAIYLIITRHVSQKYTAVTQMKWVFLISSIAVLPWAYNELPVSRLVAEPHASGWMGGVCAMVFIVVFATVLGYFLIPYAMKTLRATTVSVYTNLQPVVASLVAMSIGQDVFSWDKPVAGVLVLLGAWLVTRER